MNYPNLDKLFNPDSIALIGATASPGKWGFIILLNILKGNYQGKVYPINPKTESILGYPCYQTVLDVPEPIDTAVITVPSKFVSAVLDDCGKKNIRQAVIISANFSETGEQGVQMEKEIIEKARKYGIRLVGPNTMGIYSAQKNLHVLMPSILPLHGNVSMFSQSGNVGVQMLAYGMGQNVGFEKFVSSGNEADITAIDYLKYFYNDKNTHIILGYVEGFEKNTEFIPVARKISKKKPIIMLKGGRTDAGNKAAASHTGSLAGKSVMTRTAFKQAGVIETISTQEMIDCAKAFSNYPLPKGKRVGIITRGGGWGVLTADVCIENGLEVPQLQEDLIAEINNYLPEYWSKGNPVDLVAAIGEDPMPPCLTLMAEHDSFDAVICLGSGAVPSVFHHKEGLEGPKELLETIDQILKNNEKRNKEPDKVFKLIGELVRKTGKPIFSVAIGSDESHRENIDKYGIVSFPTPGRAVRVLSNMYKYRRYLNLSN